MTVHRRQFLRAATFGGIAAAGSLVGHAQDLESGDFVTAETQAAISRGLAFLGRRAQAPDGSYDDGQGSPNVAITALAALALMAGGHQPGRGTYGRAVSRAVDYVLSKANNVPAGYLHSGDNAGGHSNMYQHGFGTLFLAELYGMMPTADRQQRLRDGLEKAVGLIVRSQNKIGGWRYQPQPSEADVSVTVAQLMALRAARNAGIFVPKSTVDAAVKYIKDCQLDDGGYCYISQGTVKVGGSGFERSAAALVGLFSAGIYDGPVVESSLKYLRKFQPAPGRGNPRDLRLERYFYYGHYYAALAMWTAGGNHWATWFPAIRDELLARTRSDPQNVWRDFSHGTAYGTAMACIVLQLPNNYLPILQK